MKYPQAAADGRKQGSAQTQMQMQARTKITAVREITRGIVHKLRILYMLCALLYALHTFGPLIQLLLGTKSRLEQTVEPLSDPSASNNSSAPPPVLPWHEWGRVHGVEWNKQVVYWPSSNIPENHAIRDTPSIATTVAEDLFLNKAFHNSLQPSKVIPFYYRATNTIQKQDITITTLVTSDRFRVLAALVHRYQGRLNVDG